MSDDLPKDFRDLNRPQNFVRRNVEDQKKAAAYLLRSGAVASFYKRIAIARRANPGFVLDLSGADLHDGCLWGINLSGTNLSGADMSGCDLRGANLSNANMRGTVL